MTTQGTGAGDPFKLVEWERKFILGAFADGVSSAGVSLGRSNGKSTVVGALLACAFMPGSPLYKRYAENICVARTLEQAAISFRHALAFLREMGINIDSRAEYKYGDSTNYARIVRLSDQVSIRALPANPKSLHGRGGGGLLICDEPSQWQNPGPMSAALRTAAGKFDDTLTVLLGTQPADPTHFFSLMLNGKAKGVYSQLHAVPKETPASTYGHLRTWRRANPSIDAFPSLKRALRDSWAATKGDPDQLAAFLSLRLNMGTADVETRMLISPEEWLSAEGTAPVQGQSVWGVDLGGSRSMSAVASYWPATGRLEALGCFPHHPGLEARERRDSCPEGTYRAMVRRSELILAGDRVADVKALLSAAVSKWGLPVGVASDRYRQAEFEQALSGVGLNIPVEWRGMGWRDGSEDVRLFRRELRTGKVTPVEQLALRYSISECITRADPAGNEKLIKRTGKARDDVGVATVLAVAAAARHPHLAEPPRRGPKVVVI